MKVKFQGTIDCNTEFELDNISQDDYCAIERFLKALDHSYCSYMNATTKLINEDKVTIITEY